MPYICATFSKIFEKLAYNQLFNYIEKHAILIPNQYGFRNNHSIDMALIDITDKISQGIDNRLYSACIFIDLSKAFDTVDHLILLSKLEHYGIRGMPLTSALGNSLSLLMVNLLINCQSVVESPGIHSRSSIVSDLYQ